MWQASGTKRKRRSTQAYWGLYLKPTHCHFCHILLAKTSHKASPDSRWGGGWIHFLGGRSCKVTWQRMWITGKGAVLWATVNQIYTILRATFFLRGFKMDGDRHSTTVLGMIFKTGEVACPRPHSWWVAELVWESRTFRVKHHMSKPALVPFLLLNLLCRKPSRWWFGSVYVCVPLFSCCNFKRSRRAWD